MGISKDEVMKIANLARLRFEDDELEEIASKLNKIIEYMDMLSEVDTSNVEPTTHVIGIKDVARPDEIKPWLTREEALKNSEGHTIDFFKVPKVLADE